MNVTKEIKNRSSKRDSRLTDVRSGKAITNNNIENTNKYGLLRKNLRAEYTYDDREKIEIIKNGISRDELMSLKEKTELDYDQLANILSVSRMTLFKKKGEERFNITTSERLFMLAELYSYGYHVFGNREKFNTWMRNSNTALGNISPISCMETIYGIIEVKNLIGRIDYGVYS